MGRPQTFDKEFKLEAVRLLELGQKSPTQLALELDMRRNQLYKWKEQLGGKGDGAFRGPGRKPAGSGEVARLKRELAKVTEERDILRQPPRTLRGKMTARGRQRSTDRSTTRLAEGAAAARCLLVPGGP